MPTKTVGQSYEALRSMNRADEMVSVQGRPLRMRKLMPALSGVLGLHTMGTGRALAEKQTGKRC